MQNLWVWHSFSPFLFFLIWYIICKDEYQIFKKHPFKISESMLQEETRMQNLWVWHSWLFLLFFPFFVSLFWNSYMIYNLQGRIPIFRRKKILARFLKAWFLPHFLLSHSVCCNFLGCTCFAWLRHHWLFLSLLFERC
jgi:hypothetical protein